MRRSNSLRTPLSRSLAVATAGFVSLCAVTAMAAPPAPAPAATAPAAAPATASTQTTTTEVRTAPASPSVVVVNTTVPAATPAPAPAAPAPDPSWVAPATQPAPAPAPVAVSPVPSRVHVDLHPHPMAAPSQAERDRLRKVSARSRARSVAVAGWATLGGTYGFSALVGTIAIDSAGTNRGRNYGLLMTMPVAGPFIAAFQTNSATGALLTTSLGVAQAVGLGMAIVGTVRHRRLKRELTLAAAPAPGGGHVGIAMRF
ncbi:MAG: hypothetical protein K0V04_04830 [Deltaproteobacteria bacterium]|nr:hypothetical protein [Deltaproteobacteria bacterium]